MTTASAPGKIILFGEHAVVYGKHALALPVRDAVSAFVHEGSGRTSPDIPAFHDLVSLVRSKLDISGDCSVEVQSRLPVAMGLGASAAFAVATIRGFSSKFGIALDDAAVNAIAFECEKLAHGTPSGIDNTLATYAVPILFRNDGELQAKELDASSTPPIVIACSSRSGLTREVVAGVSCRHEKTPEQYDAIFQQIDALSVAGAFALEQGHFDELGRLMNICQGLLTAIEVSTPELESMVGIARAAGAVGAKLTGAGGGGSIIALCPDRIDAVSEALQSAGFRTLGVQ